MFCDKIWCDSRPALDDARGIETNIESKCSSRVLAVQQIKPLGGDIDEHDAELPVDAASELSSELFFSEIQPIAVGRSSEFDEAHPTQGCTTQSVPLNGAHTTTTAGGNKICDDAANRLQAARRQGHERQLRLRGPTLLFGSLSLLIGIPLAYLGRNYTIRFALANIVIWFGIVVTPMSLLPSDVRAVPLAIKIIAIPCSFIAASVFALGGSQRKTCRFVGENKEQACWLITIDTILNATNILTLLVMAAYFLGIICRKRSPAGALARLWRVISRFSLVYGLVYIAKAIIRFGAGSYELGGGSTVIGLSALTACLVSRRFDLILRMQSWLMSQGEAAAAAAGVAELLGGQDPELVLVAARHNFTCVKADKLTAKDMRENSPNPALAAFAQHAHLGHVDAFVSHSWHDDPSLKWSALQAWREEFKKHSDGQEPSLWIDKYCIDQNNIDESLACLPVYLAGCKKLLILCGSTYIKRLWCLIEIFVFLEMGGKIENLEIRLLEHKAELDLRPSRTTMSSSSVACGLVEFDCANARCFTEEDTVRLQQVINVAGSGKINELISDAFLSKKSEFNV